MCDENNSKSKNSINSIFQYTHVVRKGCFVAFTALQLPYEILCLDLMTA